MNKISDILAKQLPPLYTEFIRINGIWSKSMTPNIAEVTTPIKMNDGILHVLVKDNIWLTELNYLKEEIKEQLAKNGLIIDGLEFRYRPQYEKVRNIKRKTYEITPEKQIYIEEIIKNIDNSELKELFVKAMKAYFTKYDTKEFIDG